MLLKFTKSGPPKFMKREIFRMLHKKCRNGIYPSSNIRRFEVPDEKVAWGIEFVEYKPEVYTSKVIYGKPWADPDINESSFKPKWNSLDAEGKIDRVSWTGKYLLDENHWPRNPLGRTGLRGRGILGRWGPNHAADPIVTRWKRDNQNSIIIDQNSKRPILQFVAIQRRDTNEWAIPGGMVDPGEKVTSAVRREFMEEALNSLQKSKEDIAAVQEKINQLFDRGYEVYKGYVDDPRNTDNAWMETMAFNFHDEDNEILNRIDLEAGDDAKNAKWIDINRTLSLYASHKSLIQNVAHNQQAHW